MSRPVVLAFVFLALLSACGSGEPAAPESAASPTAIQTQADTILPEEPASATIADILRSEARFSRFRDVVERTESGSTSILRIWDQPTLDVTVFVPTNAAFDALDPAVAAVIEDPGVDNDLLYSLFGHHYVHSPYPSDNFKPGDQNTWSRSASGAVQLSLA